MVPGTVKAENGKIIGSRDYFKSYNEKVKIAGLLKESSSCSYYSDLASKKTLIKKAMSEILSDLENNAASIRFLSQSSRQDLQKFLKALNTYLKFVKENEDSIKTKCDNILTLRDGKTKITAGITQREIDDAVKKIYSGGHYSRIPFTERKQLVEKAVKSGLKNTIKSYQDIVKRSFLYDIAGSHDEKFLKDVLINYRNTYQYKGNYPGNCGKNIASKEYIDYHEKAIFNRGLGSDFYKDYNYKNYIIKHLTELADLFMYDLQKVTNENDRKQFQAIIKDLEKCGVKMHATYHGNPHMPKHKTYIYTLSKKETKIFANIVKFERQPVIAIVQFVAGLFIGAVSESVYKAFLYSSVSGVFSYISNLNWDKLIEAAENGKRYRITIKGMEGESGAFMIEKVDLSVLD